MRFWRRRKSGRHQLGAAVTAIPSAPSAMRAAVPAAAPAAPVAPTWVAPPPAPPVAAPPAAAPPVPPAPTGPRVELGFRDGSTAALDPDSDQARALAGLAQSLTAPR